MMESKGEGRGGRDGGGGGVMESVRAFMGGERKGGRDRGKDEEGRRGNVWRLGRGRWGGWE